MPFLKALLRLVGAIFVLALLQWTWPPMLRWGGQGPDFLLVLTTVLALLNGPLTGATSGFLSGVFLLAGSAEPPARLLLVRTLLGWGAGLLRRGLFSENLFVHWLVVSLLTLLEPGLYRGIAWLWAPSPEGLRSVMEDTSILWLLFHNGWSTLLLYQWAYRRPINLDE